MKKRLKISMLVILTMTLIAPQLSTQASVEVVHNLVVLHPHSADFAAHVISAFQNWYADENPGDSIVVQTTEQYSGACYDLVESWNGSAPEADVWWGGGEYYFENARRGDLLTPYTVVEDVNISDDLGGWHLKDDSGDYADPAWYAAAISGFGIMYNTEYLAAENLPIPTTWDDLLKHEYKDHIVMANPDFSGSTVAAVKQVLMEKNTQTDAADITDSANISEGWAYWASMSGNVGEFTSSSTTVPAMVYEGTYGIGVVIDYYAYDKIALSDIIGFNYGGATTVSPDPAGIIKNAANMPEAQAFMDYLTSTEGQVKVGKYRTPANIEAVPESNRIPRAWDDAGAMNTDFPTIVPYNVSLDGAFHYSTEKIFNYWIVSNHLDVIASWDAIGKATDNTAKANAIALHTQLPPNLNGTIAGQIALNAGDPNIQGNWTAYGATNFDAALAEAPLDYNDPIVTTTTTTVPGVTTTTTTTTTTEGTEQIPGFESVFLLLALGTLVVVLRKKK
jgi:ABC-type Fe3+ transport system substrate-binding protein